MAVGDNIQVTEGSGKRLATGATYTENSQTVQDEKVILGEPYLPTYGVSQGSLQSIASAGSHLIEIMAGASLNVYIRRIQVFQVGLATTAALARFELLRLATAGTGGSSFTFQPWNTTDPNAGATAMLLATSPGTESTRLWAGSAQLIQTVGTGGTGTNPLLLDLDFDRLRQQSPRIAAGTSNGLCLKNITGHAGATVLVDVTITEAPF